MIYTMLNFMWERQKKYCRRLMNVTIFMRISLWWIRRERAVTRACWHVSTQMQPKRVVYVSCDPATLARDLKYLEERDYKVKEVQCVDMFGHSVHVETVVLLQRKNM